MSSSIELVAIVLIDVNVLSWQWRQMPNLPVVYVDLKVLKKIQSVQFVAPKTILQRKQELRKTKKRFLEQEMRFSGQQGKQNSGQLE